MQPIYLLDDSLELEIFFSSEDCDLEDNICLRVMESCPEDEKIFKHDESHLFLTRKQARALADALLNAARSSEEKSL
ncbi:hypothetical protein SDC9_99023 [bioreactor metagenome]|uniref:Uncharacterized protein n=1 Tax=bioreactor metagenome TaxID=1076179 RepID=A0A645AH39_9ZZZZ